MDPRSEYYGLPVRSIGNRHLTVDYLAEAGPRLVGLRLAGQSANLLGETPDDSWPTPFGTFHLYGGHRLWHAPEAMPRSSVPDGAGLTVTETPDGVRLQGPVEVYTGLQKTIEISVDPERPVMKLTHRLRNEGPWAVEMALWAITMLPFGGVAILPQPGEWTDAHGLTPNRNLSLWPYTHLTDPRLDLHRDDCWFVSAPGSAQPCKIGYFNRHGWVAFSRGGVLLVKRFEPQPGRLHADGGCNVEVFAGLAVIELETLSPLCRLEPHQEAEHVETWEIYVAGQELPADVAPLAALGG